MKPTLIILHGALGCKEQFTEWKKVLNETYDCHLFDFSGHGSRSSEDVKFSIEIFSEDLKKYISQNNLRQPNVLGYSMGGYVALYTALNTEGVLGNIMTIATKFDWNLESSKKEAGYLQPQLMRAKVPQLVEQLKKNHGKANWETVVSRTAEMMLSLGAKPLITTENVGRIKNKVKFCVGDKDKMVSITETMLIYKNVTGDSLCVLPDTGHLPESMKTERIKFEAQDFFAA